jgi:chaperone LolA
VGAAKAQHRLQPRGAHDRRDGAPGCGRAGRRRPPAQGLGRAARAGLTLLSALALHIALAGSARAATAEEIWSAYEKRWLATRSYSASFRQKIEIAGVDGPIESAGKFYFARPDRMRWDYVEGQKQLVVGDGKTVWIYQPDLEQVYRVDYSTAFGSGGLVALLAGREGLSRRYRTTLLDAGTSTIQIRLIPADGAGEMLDLTMAAGTMDLVTVRVTDPAGSVTVVDFDDASRNGNMDEALFRFTPPAGVDVIDSTPPPAQ